MIQIDKRILDACNHVLSEASKIETFSKDNASDINKLLEWLGNPNKAVSFSLNISLSNNGESTYSEFGFDRVKFFISETHHSYEPGVGGDTFTTYEFTLSDDVCEEVGDIYSWENQAIEMLAFFGQESPKVEVIIYVED